MKSLVVVLLLASCVLVGCSFRPSPGKLKAGVKFEIRGVAVAADAGTFAAQDPDTGIPLPLADPPLVTTADVASAEARTDADGQTVLDVTLHAAGAKRLAAATATPGDRFAILVNGRVVEMPVVRSPLGARITVTGRLQDISWRDLLE